MSNPNALYLLADHIKLSLLERQRSKSVDLLDGGNKASSGGAAAEQASAQEDASTGQDAQDGHISRSLDQLRDGLQALKQEQARLESEGEENKALNIADALPALQKKLDDLTSQFHGFAATASEAASSSAAATKPSKTAKAVRFQDKPLPPPGGASSPFDTDLEAQRAGLFNRPYRDEPDPEDNQPDAATRYNDLDNQQLYQMHSDIIADQDAHLDALGASISRQRELSMQIGDELDSHAAMLEETDRLVDRHQSRLDRAKRSVNKFARAAGESKQMVAIIVLIIVLVLLIIILK